MNSKRPIVMVEVFVGYTLNLNMTLYLSLFLAPSSLCAVSVCTSYRIIINHSLQLQMCGLY